MSYIWAQVWGWLIDTKTMNSCKKCISEALSDGCGVCVRRSETRSASLSFSQFSFNVGFLLAIQYLFRVTGNILIIFGMSEYSAWLCVENSIASEVWRCEGVSRRELWCGWFCWLSTLNQEDEWSKEKQQEVEDDHMKEFKKVEMLEMRESCGVWDQRSGGNNGPLECYIWARFLHSKHLCL